MFMGTAITKWSQKVSILNQILINSQKKYEIKTKK